MFSNELQNSPKGLPPGSPVTVVDSKGSFLAHGYGNPNSLISFRALSFRSQDEQVCDPEFVQRQVLKAWWQRQSVGYQYSHRLIYGEGDFLPGLVIDRYVTKANGSFAQVLAVQVLTFGMSEILKSPEEFFERLVDESVEKKISTISWSQTAVVLRNDVGIRRLEGLEVNPPRTLKEVEGVDLTNCCIEMAAATDNKASVGLWCDLAAGQKTGFFLDQAYNIELFSRLIEKVEFPENKVRVLDLCCYVGHWSTQLTKVLKARGLEVEVTQVDVSEKALAFAKRNAEAQGAIVNTRELDVLKDLGALPERYFDIVIADPPAFIKAKKDVPTGRHAYLKLNTSAFKLVRKGGFVVSCSCSGLFEEAEMMDVIRKSISRGELEARCLLHGGHSADHPVLLSFNEGFYLKMYTHQVL